MNTLTPNYVGEGVKTSRFGIRCLTFFDSQAIGRLRVYHNIKHIEK